MNERNLSILKFSEYTVPEFLTKSGKDWIFYGEENKYPEYLNTLFTRSAKHNAIVTAKKEYITGNGFIIDKAQLKDGELPIVDTFLKRINIEETANDILEKCALDLEIFGGFAMQVIYTKGTSKISEIYHIPFNKVRKGKYYGQDRIQNDPNQNEVFDFYLSDDWTKYRQTASETGFRGFPAWNPGNPVGTQILYFMSYRPKAEVYPMPDYIGCIPYIELDYEIANFHLNNIKNGFWGSFLINFNNGIPTIEEQEALEKMLKNKFTGSGNAGRFILNFSDDKTKAPDLMPMQLPDIDKQFAILNDTVQQEIFTGHKITSPMLFGVKTPGQLGGRDELREASELFQNTYVNNKQQILARVFNTILSQYGIGGNPLKIQPTEPLKWELPGVIVAQAMTKDEIRENAGLPLLNRPGITDILPPEPQPVMAPTKLSKQPQEDFEYLISRFAAYGRAKKDLNIIRSQRVRFEKESELIDQERDFTKMYFDTVKAIEGQISTASTTILKYLKGHPKATISQISKNCNLPEYQVSEELSNLLAEGYVGTDGLLTDSGRGAISEGNKNVIIENVYDYSVMPGLGDPIIPTSREFCKKMIELDKAYTRREIQAISDEVGYSVWLYRGGFYRNPDTGDTTPYCRHDWFRRLIIREA